jgi:hypothetical protein
MFGQSGLVVLTFIVSLFEIHGSIIANIQLYNSGAFNIHWLGSLLALSIVASYISKLFIISILGSLQIRTYIIKLTLVLALSQLAAWIAFLFI